jgi:ABC-type nitrate/sulfonate/bicarbonate transport system substrate-binding protein
MGSLLHIAGEFASRATAGRGACGAETLVCGLARFGQSAAYWRRARQDRSLRASIDENRVREDEMKRAPMRLPSLLLASLLIAASTAGAPAADKLRIGKAVPFAWTFTPIEVGVEVGTFRKHGLELEVSAFAGDARMQQGLVSDSIDIGFGSGPGMAFMAKGVPAKAVAAMAGAPMNMSMVVLYDSPIRTLDEIKGKRIGITTVGSLTDWLLKRVVADKRWSPGDVTAVTVGGMDSTKAALKTRQIDGVVFALESGYALEAVKEWRVLAPLAPFAPDFHTHVIFARNELIAGKPELVERFLRGWFETIAFMRADKPRSVEITAKVLNLDPAVISRVYDEQIGIFTSDGRFDPKALAVLRRSLVEMGLLPTEPDDAVMLTTRFLPVKF